MCLRKWTAALLALCLLLAAIPAATMEDLEIGDMPVVSNDGELLEVTIDGEAPEEGGFELPSEVELTDDGIALESTDIDLSEIDPALSDSEAGDLALDLAANDVEESLVKIVRPADGATVSTGNVELWCTFVNDNPSGGFSAGDAWKYIPLTVQVLKDGEVIDSQVVSNYRTLIFTDEGLHYADVRLRESGTYMIRASVPGSADLWDSVTVTVSGTSVTPEPQSTRAPVTDDTLVVITSPAQNEVVQAATKIPVRVKLRKPATGVWFDALYAPVRIEVLGSRGNLVWATEVGVDNIDGKLDNGTEWTLAEPSVDVGGSYTIRVRADGSSTWDSIQVYAEGPSYPVSKEAPGYSVTPDKSMVSIDLAKDKTARIGFTLRSDADPSMNYIYYADFVESGDDIIKYKQMYDYQFVKSGDSWVAEGWIEYTGVKIGTATLHMYLLVNGTRYNHHAVTVNVIDSSKISASTPTPTPKPTPKPTPTPAPKVNLSKCKATAKDQVYTGKALKPAVTVKYGKKTLKKGTDYTVTYKNNKAVGTATATLKGKGKYTGTKKVSFKILPPKVALSKLEAGSKSFTATWKKSGVATGYQLQYALKKSFSGANTVKVKKAGTVSATVKSLQSGKTYYVRVRVYKTVNKKNYYSAWSAAKSVKVK